jgi:hypothetical protein
MEVKYYIGTRPQAGGYYFIHREDCPLLPSHGKRMYLGTFLSPVEAAEEAKKYFSDPDYCRFCLEKHHKEIRRQLLAEANEKWDIVSSVLVIATRESGLVCGVN